MSKAILRLSDGSTFVGESFGYEGSVSGEVVFNTAMSGYPESLTDPSYAGQLMVLTYPLVGNYGVPPFTIEANGLATFMESDRIYASAIIVSEYSGEYSHWNAKESLAEWLQREHVAGITGIDTRALTKRLRENGVMIGTISIEGQPDAPKALYEGVNFVDKVSTKEVIHYYPTSGKTQFAGTTETTKTTKTTGTTETTKTTETTETTKAETTETTKAETTETTKAETTETTKAETTETTKAETTETTKTTEIPEPTPKVLLVDCGVKHNILRCLLRRGVEVIRVPWNYDFNTLEFDALFLSNGPGDPDTCMEAVEHIRQFMAAEEAKHDPAKVRPLMGICMGNQLLGKAAGATIYKLKYGHRSHNQPVREVGTERCFITSQNHGYAVDTTTLGSDWEPLFVNMNDGSNEGIRHKHYPWYSAQFHPEACSGPTDTEFLFDQFVALLHK